MMHKTSIKRKQSTRKAIDRNSFSGDISKRQRPIMPGGVLYEDGARVP